MAARSRPPNAGFQAINRPFRASRSTASPVNPAPKAAAARAATSRPHRVPGARIAQGSWLRAQAATPEQLADDVKRLEELGVNHLLLNFQSETLDATLARMDGFASKVRPLL